MSKVENYQLKKENDVSHFIHHNMCEFVDSIHIQ